VVVLVLGQGIINCFPTSIGGESNLVRFESGGMPY
jgi:hypothetical protein